MVYYKPVKITINTSRLVKVIINMIVHKHDIFKSIIINKHLLFISNFLFLQYYFLRIKTKLYTTFYLQIDDQTKRQNSIIKIYFRIFVYWK